MPIPWDMVVFLTITIVGFGYSIHRLIAQIPMEATSARRTVQSLPAQSMLPQTADLGCLEQPFAAPLESVAGMLRFRGRFCKMKASELSAFESIQIRNATNGFEGTVFVQDRDGSFVTDYVMLEKGANQIEIEWTTRGAKPERLVTQVVDR